MTKQVFLLRHPEHNNGRINLEGRNNYEHLAEKIQQEIGETTPYILSSSAPRAVDGAEVIADYFGMSLDRIVKTPFLWTVGDREGLRYFLDFESEEFELYEKQRAAPFASDERKRLREQLMNALTPKIKQWAIEEGYFIDIEGAPFIAKFGSGWSPETVPLEYEKIIELSTSVDFSFNVIDKEEITYANALLAEGVETNDVMIVISHKEFLAGYVPFDYLDSIGIPKEKRPEQLFGSDFRGVHGYHVKMKGEDPTKWDVSIVEK